MDLYAVKADGSTRMQLTDTPDVEEYSPQYSPDGTRLLYVRRAEDAEDLWVLDLETGEHHNLTEEPGRGEFHAAWAPGGEHIAFMSYRPKKGWIAS